MADKSTNERARLRWHVNAKLFTKRDVQTLYREGTLEHRDFSATDLLAKRVWLASCLFGINLARRPLGMAANAAQRGDTVCGATSAVQRVGWVEPTGRANARPMINSAIPIAPPRRRSQPMGFASAQPILRAVPSCGGCHDQDIDFGCLDVLHRHHGGRGG